MIKGYHVYMQESDMNKLKAKSIAEGFSGKGFVSKYLVKIANTEIIFLDSNAKKFIAFLDIKSKKIK